MAIDFARMRRSLVSLPFGLLGFAIAVRSEHGEWPTLRSVLVFSGIFISLSLVVSLLLRPRRG